jgi:predicted TIM-barrel fold metal-dependent hydrolase
MIFDSHMHLIRRKNFCEETYKRLGLGLPKDTDIDQLVSWMKEAGIEKAVCMGQDMTRIWNTTFGEEYVLECYKKYPDFFIPFASVEPVDKAGRFHQENFDYLVKAVDEYGFKGVLFTPPYGQFMSNDKTMYPFYEFAQKRGIVVQYHHSAQMGPAILAPTKYAQMTNLNDVLIDFPDMKVVVEHLGYPWAENLFVLMANDKNLYTDLAMTFGRPTWLAWNLVLAKEYGVIDRIMFASDYVAYDYDCFSENPSEDLKKWINYVRKDLNEICRKSGWPEFTQEEIDGFLYKTASKLYNI